MDKKSMVIESARKLFTLYGYKKVSMDEIARDSKVTKKTIYTYFKDKEDMFKYFVDEELIHMKGLIEKIRKSDKPFIEQLSLGIYKVLTYRNNSKLFNNILNEFKNDNSIICENFIKMYDSKIIEYIEELINEEISCGNIKSCDSHLTAFIIYKTYLSVMFDYDREIDEKKFTEKLISILENGFIKKKEDESYEK